MSLCEYMVSCPWLKHVAVESLNHMNLSLPLETCSAVSYEDEFTFSPTMLECSHGSISFR